MNPGSERGRLRRGCRGVNSRGVNSRGVTLIEMLVVMTILGIVASIAYPSVSAGLDSLRLSTTCDDVASLFAASVNFAERRQRAVEIRIQPKSVEATAPGFSRRINLDTAISISGEPRSVFIDPAATVPGTTIEVTSQRGFRRTVRIDPITGAAEVN